MRKKQKKKKKKKKKKKSCLDCKGEVTTFLQNFGNHYASEIESKTKGHQYPQTRLSFRWAKYQSLYHRFSFKMS